MNVNGKLSKKFEGLFLYKKSSPERIVQGSLSVYQRSFTVILPCKAESLACRRKPACS